MQDRYIAVVDEIDRDAVLDLFIGREDENGVLLWWRRASGRWVYDDLLAELLHSDEPPTVIDLEESVAMQVVRQVDRTGGARSIRAEGLTTAMGWVALADRLKDVLGSWTSDLGQHLVIELRKQDPYSARRDPGRPFVQFAAFGDAFVRAEASGNDVVADPWRLTADQVESMAARGWWSRDPTIANFTCETPTDWSEELGARAIEYLRMVGINRVSELTVECWGGGTELAGALLTDLGPREVPVGPPRDDVMQPLAKERGLRVLPNQDGMEATYPVGGSLARIRRTGADRAVVTVDFWATENHDEVATIIGDRDVPRGFVLEARPGFGPALGGLWTTIIVVQLVVELSWECGADIEALLDELDEIAQEIEDERDDGF